ncbi:hypothetical protein PtrV1_13583 [Pyrenophora tritici-repentis]|nr:hypothetical protein PtrV1_13583 [Pyrenophora tritici-repentis]
MVLGRVEGCACFLAALLGTGSLPGGFQKMQVNTADGFWKICGDKDAALENTTNT